VIASAATLVRRSIAMSALATVAGLLGLPTTAVGEPYRHHGRPAQDQLTFWGWSASGGSFAYETYTSAEREDVDCSEQAVLRVIDATRDREIAVLRVVSGAGNQADRCQVTDVRAALAKRRAAFLTQHHILDAASPPAGFDRAATGSAATQDADWKTTLPGGREITARFEEHQGPDQKWASYRLVFQLGPRRQPAIATPRIAGALGFDMEDAMVFHDKAHRHAAVCVSLLQAAHHGHWATWDCHGLVMER